MKKTKKRTAPHERRILQMFEQASRPLTRKDIGIELDIPKARKEEIENILEDLIAQGKLIRIGRGYGLVKKMPMTPGILEVQRSGVGFVLPEDKRLKDIFISRSQMGGAWHGDRVLVSILPRRRGKNPEGRIVRVVERARPVIAVRVVRQVGLDTLLCQPTDPRLHFNVLLTINSGEETAKVDDIVLAIPEEEIEKGVWSAKIDRVLGREEDASVQEALVKVNWSVPTVFPEAVVNQAEGLPDVPQSEDCREREDLRELPFVTIDGASARDFDDAVLARPENGKWRLWVAIADVSHYVPQGSALDEEALERGNSYYFPQSVEPMFPEKLSNGLCSLVPGEPRLSMVAEMLFSADGDPVEERFYPAVIRSHGRLTYEQVKRVLLDNDAAEQERLRDHLPMLRDAEKLARRLLARRVKRGALDFDLPEPEILIDICDHPEDIRPRARHFGHQIVEEFMLAANEAVARFLEGRQARLLYRNHPEPDPDKLDALFNLLRNTPLGASLPEQRDAKGIQQLFAGAQGSEIDFLVNRLALRSMMQAEYAPENKGHFGLASDCYCHFTSPIRRYADLVVHRALKGALGFGSGGGTGQKKLKEVADQVNVMERRATGAEREIVKRLTILFLKDKVGQTFNGIVSSMADFGFWVELKEVMAEGMVPLSSLGDDYYNYREKQQEMLGERTGRRFRLGQELRVRLEEVSLSRIEVNLTLAE
ncbi:MAG: ribonuclease R [Desulfuromonadaceae bacterium]|nr:ribonuclease R [Desulfuromonadaceae bacterium]